MSTIVTCACHVERLEQHHDSNMLPTYVATKTKQTKRKKLSILKKGIDIESEKYASKLDIKNV